MQISIRKIRENLAQFQMKFFNQVHYTIRSVNKLQKQKTCFRSTYIIYDSFENN